MMSRQRFFGEASTPFNQVTYAPNQMKQHNLHIMIRYELEKLMVEGDIEVDEIPDAWDAMYEEYLGIKPPNRTIGVLQDIHWCMGAIGYFPTYTLQNLYAAQLLEAARDDIPDHDERG